MKAHACISITMPQSTAILSSFDRTTNVNNFTIPQSLDHDGIVHGYSFLSLCPVAFYLVFSNSLLLYVIISNRKKPWARRINHIFHLILCDLIVGVSLILIITVRLLRLNIKPYWFCAIFVFTLSSTQTVSYYHILA